MTDIPKEAEDMAFKLAAKERPLNSAIVSDAHYSRAFARFIADVSETAEKAQAAFAALEGFYHRLPGHIEPTHQEAREELSSLILPDSESDLLKEAREICARESEGNGLGAVAADYRRGYYDDAKVVRCTLAALKHRKDG